MGNFESMKSLTKNFDLSIKSFTKNQEQVRPLDSMDNCRENKLGDKIFNFLDPKLSPSIKCFSPATDNYEVDNLISEDPRKKNLGFIAYSSIKPPVEIELKFICPIDIHYIILKTVVGSQKSTGIEILAKNDSYEYRQICKSIYSQSGIFFCNSRRYSKVQCPRNFDDKIYHLGFFNRNSYGVFLEATFIKLIIFRTERSVPCIGAIEVWGTPAKACSQVTHKTIAHIMKTKPVETPVTSEEFCIPDDFKDDLTYEVMAVPITLPSGKTVDQSTLDKHIKIEAQFRRKPCDPFTGIKFSDKLKPVLNVALKSRIDMFMLQNSYRSELVHCKRTLGKSSSVSKMDICNKKSRVRLNDDLDEEIAKIKESPNFINVTNDDSIDNTKCVKCKKNNIFMYKIPCGHFHCRECLNDILKNLKCSFCENIFYKKHVEKINI